MSNKLEELRRSAGGNVRESMGVDRSTADQATVAAGPPVRWQGLTKPRDAHVIPLDRIAADPDQPRKVFDEEALRRLAESLKARGQLQPVRVRWDEELGKYVLLMGERRWRAATLAGLPALTCIVHDAPLTTDERLMVQLVENAVREDLTPIEQGRAYKALMEARGWSQRQLAEELHVGQASISRALAQLELTPEVQAMVEAGTLAASAAVKIAELSEAEQVAAARSAVDHGLSRDEIGRVVQAIKAKRPAPAPRPDPVTIDLGDGVSVTVRWRKATPVTAAKALRMALKVAQDRERDEAGEAA